MNMKRRRKTGCTRRDWLLLASGVLVAGCGGGSGQGSALPPPPGPSPTGPTGGVLIDPRGVWRFTLTEVTTVGNEPSSGKLPFVFVDGDAAVIGTDNTRGEEEPVLVTRADGVVGGTTGLDENEVKRDSPDPVDEYQNGISGEELLFRVTVRESDGGRTTYELRMKLTKTEGVTTIPAESRLAKYDANGDIVFAEDSQYRLAAEGALGLYGEERSSVSIDKD